MMLRRISHLSLACLAACSSRLSESSGQYDVMPAPFREAEPVASTSPNAPIFGEDDALDGSNGPLTGDGCVGVTASTEVLPAVLQLLVDTSGSMNENAPGVQKSKWEVTRTALLEAIAGIPAEAALGVLFYPNVPQNAEPCFDRQTAVPIDVLGPSGSPHRQAMAQAFANQMPQGGTPTHDAYQFALSEVQASPAVGRRYVVLITDGVPTFSLGCAAARGFGRMQQTVDTAPLIAEAASALGRDLQTFVIGSPGSEDGRESLSRTAEAGGTAKPGCSHQGPNYCHFDMTTESDLSAGLENALRIITGTALSCDYTVPSAPQGSILDLAKVNIAFTTPAGAQESLVQSVGASCEEGWRYNEDQTSIVLCPATCERIRSSRGQVTLRFGCTSVLR